jgi:hypothetical protein
VPKTAEQAVHQYIFWQFLPVQYRCSVDAPNSRHITKHFYDPEAIPALRALLKDREVRYIHTYYSLSVMEISSSLALDGLVQDQRLQIACRFPFL